MSHCGIWMDQDAHGTWHLGQEDGEGKELTSSEVHQCRAVLGAAQWRCYQSGPQHCARLSHLQSLLPRGD